MRFARAIASCRSKLRTRQGLGCEVFCHPHPKPSHASHLPQPPHHGARTLPDHCRRGDFEIPKWAIAAENRCAHHGGVGGAICPPPAAIAEAKQRFQQLGFSVLATGITLTLQAEASRFQTVFNVKLNVNRDETTGMTRYGLCC